MKITVIGLGLIGGSMALDLKTRGFATHIIGVDNNPQHCKQALALGIADEIKLLDESLHSEVVILAIPVTETAKLLPHILDNIGENTVVMDVGSTKQQICKAIKTHPKRKQFVGTHPIAGTENSGPSASIKNLCDNKVCILCVDDSALWVVERVSELCEALDMKMLFMNADEHDMHVAYVSHLSHISSFALATTVLEMEKNTYPDPRVISELHDFVAIKVDTQKRIDIETKYGIAYYPTMVLLDPNGKEITRYIGYLGPEDMVKFIRDSRGKLPKESPGFELLFLVLALFPLYFILKMN